MEIKDGQKKNKFSNIYGYSKGFENIQNLVNYSLKIKLPYLTIFALSSENFKRTSINIIYEIIYKNFSENFKELLMKNGVRIKIFGSRENLPPKIIKIFDDIENISSDNNNLNLNIAFNYGFKDEVKNLLLKLKENKYNIDFSKEEQINNLFDIGSYPDPDILIRTGGHKRLSNFIMYNLTYTELFFTETLWPDFTEKELQSIISQYISIDRKYGL